MIAYVTVELWNIFSNICEDKIHQNRTFHYLLVYFWHAINHLEHLEPIYSMTYQHRKFFRLLVQNRSSQTGPVRGYVHGDPNPKHLNSLM